MEADLSLRSDDPRRRLILALDVPGENEALRLADSLRPELAWVKVGLQLFTACGPDVVRRLVSLGLRVFLDLKLHDIPNTVAGAVRSAARLGVSMLSVHASGGTGMLRAAVEAAREGVTSPAIIAVTLLTSLGQTDIDDLGFSGRPRDMVLRLAALGLRAGVDGLVTSPREVALLRAAHGNDPLLVTPGVRPSGSAADDQARIAAPGQAVQDGADYLVIGRPITRDPDPAAAADRIAEELAGSS
jgi:orotidine-5'-phosphate decarboxylase